MEYIEKEQLDKLIKTMIEFGLQNEWVKRMLNVEDMHDITVWQYNYLLLIIQQVKDKYGK